MNTVDCVVIGAGVIGLATARAMALTGREVLVLERESHFGTQTSSRNSEVIHAGIYYEPNTIKAQSCLAGRDRLYRYCIEHQIDHRQCGKYIVAVDESHIRVLEKIEENARRCGVFNLQWLDSYAARREEPQLACVAALNSPSTGIIDSHQYMLSLLGEAEANGATLVLGTEVTSIEPASDGLRVRIGGDERTALGCRTLINAGGLHCVQIAQSVQDLPATSVPTLHYAKGSYFALTGASPFHRLIYPVPEADGLGVHMTMDLAGHTRFGPDVEWVSDLNYDVQPARVGNFYAAIRRYWPGLPDDRLHPAYAGIRPKLSAPGEPTADFIISGPEQHGMRGLVNFFGIESPGLTASLDLADRAVRAAVGEI